MDNIVDGKRSIHLTPEKKEQARRRLKPDPHLESSDTPVAASSDSDYPQLPSTPLFKTPKRKRATPASGRKAISTPRAKGNEKKKEMEMEKRKVCGLLNGYVFVLTRSKVREGRREKGEENSDDSSENRVEFSLLKDSEDFKKEQLEADIKEAGGTVKESISDALETAGDPAKVYLLSDSHCGTGKYIQALAASIPCISNTWISKSIQRGRLLHPKDFVLPRGFSTTLRELVETSIEEESQPLRDLRILLASKDSHFLDFWQPVIGMSGCQQLFRLPKLRGRPISRAEEAEAYAMDVVVTDRMCPPSVLSRANALNVPIVSSFWVLECLIMGEPVPFDAHPSFAWDYKPQ